MKYQTSVRTDARKLRTVGKQSWRLLLFLLVAVALTTPGVLRGQADNQPVTPFKIAEHLFYVGGSDVTAFLFTTPKGLILLDTGSAENAPQIVQNVRSLGFSPTEIKYILVSHGHYDHVGGLARLKRLTGAKVVASDAEVALLQKGGRGDFNFGDKLSYEPVTVDRAVHDGDKVELGNLKLTAHLTAGHTKGCTSWTTTALIDGRTENVVFLCSVTVPRGYKLVDNPQYPTISADYRRSFNVLASLPCDVLLGTHGSFFELSEKIAALKASAHQNPFVNPAECSASIESSRRQFEAEYLRQLKEPPGK